MEGRFFCLFLALLLAAPGVVHALEVQAGTDPVIQPEVARADIDPAAIDSEDFELGVYAGLMSVEDFGVNTVLGVRLAYHVSESFFFEAALGQTSTEETSYERLSGAAQLLTDDERDLSYYSISVGYNVLPGEAFVGAGRAYNTAFYLIGGVGGTEFAGDRRFTVNLGAGYRLLLNDWIALRVDVRDHMFDIDLLGEEKSTHNIEFHAGIAVFF